MGEGRSGAGQGIIMLIISVKLTIVKLTADLLGYLYILPKYLNI